MQRHTLGFFLFFLVLILNTQVSFSQPGALWIRNFDNGRAEGFNDIYAVSDSGYIMCGTSGNNWPYGNVWYVVKVDVNGQLIWSETYGEDQMGCLAKSVIEADNGDFVIAGQSAYNGRVTVLRIN